jgi:aldose 1-epimerase
LHGGEWGIHRACFLSEVRQEAGVSEVSFSYSSVDGEGGFPGKVDIAVTYSWQDDGTLRVDIRAETDQRTPLNMTHHAYWNLRGSFGTEVWSHELQIPSSYYATTNDECISDGKVAASRLTPMDFRFRRPVGHGVGLLETSGYDHCLILDRPGEGMAQAAHLRDPKSGRNMTLWTNQLALQVYSANGFEGSFENSEGECVVQHGGICLEPQAPPGALHHDDLGSLIVEPGTPYVNRSFFCFFVN